MSLFEALENKSIKEAAELLNIRVDTLLAWIAELKKDKKISDFTFI